jgi:hypothetical protein
VAADERLAGEQGAGQVAERGGLAGLALRGPQHPATGREQSVDAPAGRSGPGQDLGQGAGVGRCQYAERLLANPLRGLLPDPEPVGLLGHRAVKGQLLLEHVIGGRVVREAVVGRWVVVGRDALRRLISPRLSRRDSASQSMAVDISQLISRNRSRTASSSATIWCRRSSATRSGLQ